MKKYESIVLKIGLFILPMVIVMLFIPFGRTFDQQAKPVVRLSALKSEHDMEIVVENVTDLYAASVDLFYDTEKIVVEKLEIGDLFVNCEKPWMEVVNSIDADQGIANFAVSLLGEVDAIKGTGVLVKIYYRILDDEMPRVKFLDYIMEGFSYDQEFGIRPKLVNDEIEYIPYRSKVQINN